MKSIGLKYLLVGVVLTIAAIPTDTFPRTFTGDSCNNDWDCDTQSGFSCVGAGNGTSGECQKP